MARDDAGWEPANWEPGADGGDDTPVIRHSKDHGSYHYAGDDITQHAGSHRFGLDPIVVPRARRDGRSSAFDPHVAAPVHVDPDMRDGGVVVDLSRVTQRDMSSALRQSRYAHQVFFNLAKTAGGDGRQVPPADDRVREDTPLRHGVKIAPQRFGYTGQYVTPPANRHGEQPVYVSTQEQEMKPVPQIGTEQPVQPARRPRGHDTQQAVRPVPAPPAQAPPAQPAQQPYHQGGQPVTQPYPQPAFQQPPPYYPPPPDPHLASTLSAISQSLQVLGDRVASIEGGPARQPTRQAPRRPKALNSASTATMPRGRGRDDEDEDEDELAPIDPPDDYDEADDGLARYKRGRSRQVAPGVEAEDAEEVAARARPRQSERLRRRLKPRPTKAGGPSIRDVGKKGKSGKTQHVSDLDEKPRDGIIVGFETLRIPFVTGPKPEKARRRVYFEYPEMGKQAANYHAVVDSDDVVVLVYDTRYEDGSQFEPPPLGPDRTIILHVAGKETVVHRVASLGLTFSLGVLDLVVLLKKRDDDDEADFEPPAEEE